MEEYLTLISVPAIAVVVYWVIELIKYTTKHNEKVLRFVPLMAAVLGIVCSIVSFYAIPEILPTTNIVMAILIGAASGLSATGFNQIIKQAKKKEADEVKEIK